jgi:HAD superfamily hydrolase (TIGR01509 family)
LIFGKWDKNIEKRLVFCVPNNILAIFEPVVGDFCEDFSSKEFFDSLVRPFYSLISMIDTILFDFVGVLLFPKENHEALPQVDEVDELIGAVTNDNVFKERILREYDLLEHEFNAILLAIVNKYEPFVPLWKLLPKIRKRHKLGIINNGTYLTYPLFDAKLHLGQQFDMFLSSATVGVCKPNPTIYLQACTSLHSEPQNCLFMDDSQENILGAQRVGMQTIHWSNKENGFQKFKTYLCNAGGIKMG